MIKRILTGTLAAAMLATATMVPGVAEGDVSLVPDSASGITLTGGEVRTPFGTSASELTSCFKNRDRITLKSTSGETLTLTDTVASGDVISCGDDSATVIVPGDVNGDAKINARDVVGAMRVILGQTDGLYSQAADAELDGEINARDVTKIMRYLVGCNEDMSGAQRVVADKDDPQIVMYFDSLLNRIDQSDTTVYGSADGLYYTAKNELEDAQIVLTSEADKKNLTLSVSAPTNENGKTLAYEVRYGHYYKDSVMFTEYGMINGKHSSDKSSEPGTYTDPYPPLTGAFDIGKNESKSFMVQVDVPADAESGYYKSDVVLKDSAGNEIKRATLRFYVWDFVLDEETACNTLFNTPMYGLSIYYSQMYDPKYGNTEVMRPIFLNNFYDYMLKNRLAGYELPVEILSDEADKYMNNPRVTSFVSFGGLNSVDWTNEEDRSLLRARYDKLQSNPVWAEKAYIYTVDEPWGLSGAELVKNQWNQAKSVLGETPFKVVVPFGNTYIDELGMDMLDYLWDYCNGFCPSAGWLSPSATIADRHKNPDLYPSWGQYPTEPAFLKYGNFQPRYDKLRERGDSMWWYVCVVPTPSYANFFNSYQGAWSRVLLWQQYLVNSDGLLYWHTALWQLNEHDSRKVNLTRTGGGDGLLIYDGMLWGAKEPMPVPSGRLEAVRDGIEDFQYMRQLEKKLGREGVLKYVTRLTTDVTHYELDYRKMVKARTEMGFELESVSK